MDTQQTQAKGTGHAIPSESVLRISYPVHLRLLVSFAGAGMHRAWLGILGPKDPRAPVAADHPLESETVRVDHQERVVKKFCLGN